MKLFRVLLSVGLFFLFSQGFLVYIFRLMLDIAMDSDLPVDQLLGYQTLIIKIVIGAIIFFGALFLLLVATYIFNALRSANIRTDNGRLEGEAVEA